MSARIIIGSDIVPTESNYKLFEMGDTDALIGRDLQEKLNSADFTIFNLEVPLTDKETPIIKCGPNLIAPIATIKGLKAINPHFFAVANNHILDHGEQGLYSTLRILDTFGIAHAGAGKNLVEASKPYIFEKDGLKVGIYCCAEHEFTIATEIRAGANPFDPLESLDHITELKAACDYIIVIYHGGKEYYRYPSPYLQKVCRKMVDKGADFVVCQHSHCIGCEEKWNGGTIVYGQGNFLFDRSESEYWKTGLLIQLDITLKETVINYIPLQKEGNKERIAQGKSAIEIIQNFNSRSEEIKKSGEVERKYRVFAEEMQWNYIRAFLGRSAQNPIYRIFNKLSNNKFFPFILKCKYKTKDRLILENYIRCEAHRELISQGIKSENSKGNK